MTNSSDLMGHIPNAQQGQAPAATLLDGQLGGVFMTTDCSVEHGLWN